MNKVGLTSIIALCLTTGAANATDALHYKELIQNKNYEALKDELINNKPDVLSREQGLSIFDYSLKLKDKHAAIIIADYHNHTISRDNVANFYESMSDIRNKLNSAEKDKVENTITAILGVIEDQRNRLNVLQSIQMRDKQELENAIELTKQEAQSPEEAQAALEALERNIIQRLSIVEESLEKPSEAEQNGTFASEEKLLAVADALEDIQSQLSELQSEKLTKEELDAFLAAPVAFLDGGM